jgi:hypothetical protein
MIATTNTDGLAEVIDLTPVEVSRILGVLP